MAGDVVRIEDVQKILELDRVDAAKRLSRWLDQGWLHRVGKGTYVPVALDTLGTARVIEDPWILVPALYSPGYIGGRTAAEHWDLTEQIFNDIVVFTTQPLRQTRQVRHGTTFMLRHTRSEKLFGTKSVWRKRSLVSVSDVHRTIIDMLDDPTLGAGIQHVSDCFATYLERADRDDNRLIDYAVRLGNGAVFKRLGFFAERSGKASTIVAACLGRLTAGFASLDPALNCPRVIGKWRLHVPPGWVSDRP